MTLDVFPDDWNRALAVVAHPDDLEYGAASAVARWTDAGKDIRYIMVTRGEAGIADMAPSVVGPARMAEELASAEVVGVSVVEFLGSPNPTHAVDIGGYVDQGRDSLREHRLYLDHLGDSDGDPTAFLLANAETTGPEIGAVHATAFEVIHV